MRNFNHLTEFINAAHEVARLNLIRCSSGNLSSKIDSSYYITSSGSWMSRLTQADVVECDTNGVSLEENKTPSSEAQMHFGIYKIKPDVKMILHFQSEFATVAACNIPNITEITDVTNQFSFIPEIPFYINKICILPYAAPGSIELANSVIQATVTYDLILLQNHGQVVIGKSFDDVIQKAAFFELAANIYSHSKTASLLDSANVSSLRTSGMSKNNAKV